MKNYELSTQHLVLKNTNNNNNYLTSEVDGVGSRAGVKVLGGVAKEWVEVLILTLVLLLLVLGLETLALEVLVGLRSVSLVGELRLLVVNLTLGTEVLVLGWELLRTLVEEASLLRVERS